MTEVCAIFILVIMGSSPTKQAEEINLINQCFNLFFELWRREREDLTLAGMQIFEKTQAITWAHKLQLAK